MCSYFELFKKGENIVEIRFKMVQYAKKHGIGPAARHFKTTKMTVRKWLIRFRTEKKAGLKSKPKHVMTPGSVRFVIKQKRDLATRKKQKRARLAEKKRLESLLD